MKTINIESILEVIIFNSITKYKATLNSIHIYRIYELTFSHVYDHIYNQTQDFQLSNYYTQKVYQNLPYELIKYDNKIKFPIWLEMQINEQMITMNKNSTTFSKTANYAG